MKAGRLLRTSLTIVVVSCITLTATVTMANEENNYLDTLSEYAYTVSVQSGSMEPCLEPGEFVLIDPMAYSLEDPRRGDIILYRYPVDDYLGNETLFIHRIVGLPDETVSIREGEIFIGEGTEDPLKEDYLKEDWVIRNDDYAFHVPERSYYVLGDNRNNAKDSRYWQEEALSVIPATGIDFSWSDLAQIGYVGRDQIVGKVICKMTPENIY